MATFKVVDTCAAEFEAYTPYFYSTYETEDEGIYLSIYLWELEYDGLIDNSPPFTDAVNRLMFYRSFDILPEFSTHGYTFISHPVCAAVRPEDQRQFNERDS